MVDGTDGAPGDLVGTSGGDAGEPAGNSSGYAGSHALYQDVFVPAASEPTPYLHYKLDRVFVTVGRRPLNRTPSTSRHGERRHVAGQRHGVLCYFPSNRQPLDDDGMGDLATYQPDTDGGSLATVDVSGIPATLAEYGLLLA